MYNLQNCLNLCWQMLTVTPATWQVLARPRLWIAKPCISYRIAPRNGFTPFQVLVHHPVPKTPTTSLLNVKKEAVPKDCPAQH